MFRTTLVALAVITLAVGIVSAPASAGAPGCTLSSTGPTFSTAYNVFSSAIDSATGQVTVQCSHYGGQMLRLTLSSSTSHMLNGSGSLSYIIYSSFPTLFDNVTGVVFTIGSDGGGGTDPPYVIPFEGRITINQNVPWKTTPYTDSSLTFTLNPAS
jgi:Spore Coat Protein U domain